MIRSLSCLALFRSLATLLETPTERRRRPYLPSVMVAVFGASLGIFGTGIAAQQNRVSQVQRYEISVLRDSFSPSRVTVKRNLPVELTFIRKSSQSCGTAIVVPSLKIKKDLPLNKPVSIMFVPKENGEVNFSCGMKMLKGAVVVK